MSVLSTFANITKVPELRKRIVFTVGMLAVLRIGTFVTVPGINRDITESVTNRGGGLLNFFNMFSGGAFGKASIFTLGIMPYVSASIVLQLLAMVFKPLEELRKEGEAGQRKINQYTRYGTLLLSMVQAFGMALVWEGQSDSEGGTIGQAVLMDQWPFRLLTVLTLTTGTCFMMWIGEQITERGIGNGISMLIFAGIVAGLPGATYHTLQMAQNGELNFIKVLLVLLIVVAVTAFVVFVERGQRRITVNYARRQGGSQAYMNQSSHLPLKLNMSGVIPAIFASSLIMFPATASSWFSNGADIRWLQQVTAALAPGEPLYEILYAVLIIVFAFFYTALVFNSNETAENLKKSGALIPGIRPGRSTAEYIDGVLTRLTGAGALYLVLVCVVPTFLQQYFHVPFYFGGTSLLIVVVVVMDFTAQVQAHLVSHQYESLLKKANLKGYGRGGSPR